ncbi:MAG TPA: CsbD family protein [Thermodesulfobacteriota bacterium]|nr:CsbD family protein [Thermodesulfobacteriota bacterium]
MSKDEIKGKLKQVGGKVREKWGKLTHNVSDIIGGKGGHLIGKVQEKYGSAKRKLKRKPRIG